ncbi:winged helix-turn-helix transcriptional regulator [Chryseobacterium ginsenosidimutans]|uniref:winged helix-turn-helix transcriptional regulator n=1 Tax=Chryseobacterium ginsenosidimutans TaxID=687846 RepID=UPI003CD071BD
MLVYYISKNLKRPSELQRMIPNADRRVMDKQLQELVLHGFINKNTFNTKVPKVEYENVV